MLRLEKLVSSIGTILASSTSSIFARSASIPCVLSIKRAMARPNSMSSCGTLRGKTALRTWLTNSIEMLMQSLLPLTWLTREVSKLLLAGSSPSSSTSQKKSPKSSAAINLTCWKWAKVRRSSMILKPKKLLRTTICSTLRHQLSQATTWTNWSRTQSNKCTKKSLKLKLQRKKRKASKQRKPLS